MLTYRIEIFYGNSNKNNKNAFIKNKISLTQVAQSWTDSVDKMR